MGLCVFGGCVASPWLVCTVLPRSFPTPGVLPVRSIYCPDNHSCSITCNSSLQACQQTDFVQGQGGSFKLSCAGFEGCEESR